MGWMLWIHVRSPWETALFAAAQMLELGFPRFTSIPAADNRNRMLLKSIYPER